jgi:hypothetical protein
VIGAFIGARVPPEFVLNAGDARDRVIHFELTDSPAIRWSPTKGIVDISTYFPNPEGTTATIDVQPEKPVADSSIDVVVDVRRPGNRPGWGTALVDFGDGSPDMRLPIEGSARTTHTYERPGDYELRVEFQLWGLESRSVVQTLHVTPR